MVIDFRCNCGKRFHAREEFAGRSLKCPRCDDILAIPRPAAAPGFVHFSCGCGKKMKAHRSDAGNLVDCPRCGKEQLIPARNQGPLPVVTPHSFPPARSGRSAFAGPLLPPQVTPRKAEDTLATQYLSPWLNDALRQQSGRAPAEPRVNPLPWVPALVLLLIVGLIAYGAIVAADVPVAKTATVEVDELTLIPTDTVEMVTIRFRELWNNDRRRSDSKALELARKMVKDLNCRESDIDRVTLLWLPPHELAIKALMPPRMAGNDVCLIVHTRSPLDPAKHQPLKPTLDPKTKEPLQPQVERFRHFSYYKAATGDKAWCYPSDKIVVVSTKAGIEHFLHSQPMSGQTPPLAESLQAARRHDLVVGVNLAKSFLMISRDSKSPYAWMTFRTAIITVDEERGRADRNVAVKLRMVFYMQADLDRVKNAKDEENKARKLKLPADWYKFETSGNTGTIYLQAKGGDAAALRVVDDMWMSLAALIDENPPLR